ncbi:hypothetical protein [Arthrobacter sp. N1]|uniref:hypothetical protein n=1 Tax=Arthrobacter sp. N1 TaxID=619291 RepID=UPI003BAF3C11
MPAAATRSTQGVPALRRPRPPSEPRRLNPHSLGRLHAGPHRRSAAAERTTAGKITARTSTRTPTRRTAARSKLAAASKAASKTAHKATAKTGSTAASTAAPATKKRTSRAPKPVGREALYSGKVFRSRLEARWLIFLDLLDVNWDYEPSHYQIGPELFYLPDFYLPEHQLWLKVKGSAFMDARYFDRMLDFQRQQPEGWHRMQLQQLAARNELLGIVKAERNTVPVEENEHFTTHPLSALESEIDRRIVAGEDATTEWAAKEMAADSGQGYGTANIKALARDRVKARRDAPPI